MYCAIESISSKFYILYRVLCYCIYLKYIIYSVSLRVPGSYSPPWRHQREGFKRTSKGGILSNHYYNGQDLLYHFTLVVIHRYISDRAHFTFSDTIWSLSLSPICRTQIMTLAETASYLVCLTLKMQLYTVYSI